MRARNSKAYKSDVKIVLKILPGSIFKNVSLQILPVKPELNLHQEKFTVFLVLLCIDKKMHEMFGK